MEQFELEDSDKVHPEEIYEPIETFAGILKGRSMVWLDSVVVFPERRHIVQLLGKIYKSIDERSERVYSYSLTFYGVMGLEIVEEGGNLFLTRTRLR